MRRYEAKQRDKDKIAELEAKLGTGPKYIVVEKIVEVPQIQTVEGENDPNICAKDMQTCEAGTQTDDIDEQDWSSSAQTMYTEAKVIAFARALKAEVEAEYEAKLQELQSLFKRMDDNSAILHGHQIDELQDAQTELLKYKQLLKDTQTQPL